MKEAIPVLLALIAGAFMPIQAGLNATLRRSLSDPMQAAFISFMVGTLGLLIYLAASRSPWPSMSDLGKIPFVYWTGGLLGAFFVAATIFLVPRLGASTMMAFILAGQVVASLLFDHYGILGYPEHPVSLMRVLGAVLLAVGVALVKMF